MRRAASKKRSSLPRAEGAVHRRGVARRTDRPEIVHDGGGGGGRPRVRSQKLKSARFLLRSASFFRTVQNSTLHPRPGAISLSCASFGIIFVQSPASEFKVGTEGRHRDHAGFEFTPFARCRWDALRTAFPSPIILSRNFPNEPTVRTSELTRLALLVPHWATSVSSYGHGPLAIYATIERVSCEHHLQKTHASYGPF